MKRFAVCLIGGLMVSTTPVIAQDSLAGARDLYAAAAYDDALMVLNRLKVTDRSVEESRSIELYRAFCLLALGRTADAEQALAAVITSQPSYRPSDADMSPRVRAAFADARRKTLPGIAAEKYAQAKAEYDQKQFASAADGFKKVLDLAADPDLAPVANQPPLSDVKTLANGFYELAVKAAVLPPLPTPAPTPAPAPASLPQPKPANRVYGVADPDVLPPIAIRQVLPAFPGPVVPEGTGSLEVIIDENGSVILAAMRAPVHPLYDNLAVSSAKTWRYKPATVDGVAVKYRKIVQIVLKPTR